LLFCGPVGTGKTFYAVAIANALIDKKVSVKVTSIAELIGQMQTYNDENKQRIIDEINHVELLVIDDVGTERDTPFGIEQVMLVINNRATSGKPAIATTNRHSRRFKESNKPLHTSEFMTGLLRCVQHRYK